MQDQMELLLKASESLSELYSHDFYPPPPMNVSFSPTLNSSSSANQKWEMKTYQLLFTREMERSEWDKERTTLRQENNDLKKQLSEAKEMLVRLLLSVNRVQSSVLIMNGSINQGYDLLESNFHNLEESIFLI